MRLISVVPSRVAAIGLGERAAPHRLQGRQLLLARILWLTLVALDVGLFSATVPGRYALQLRTAQAQVVRANLGDLGLAPATYALLQVANQIVVSTVCCVVAGIVFWRRSDELIALFVGLFLVTFGAPPLEAGLPTAHISWYAARTLRFIGLAMLPAFFYLFPDGRFVPHWTRWLTLGWAAQMVYFIFGPTLAAPLQRQLAALGQVTYLGILGSLVVAQVYRYRSVSSPEQRQQTKWVITALLVVVFVGSTVLVVSLTSGWRLENGTRLSIASAMLVGLTLLLIPIGIGLAILRYRLWDVDPIINRTLVYGGLTASVVGIYLLVVGGVDALLVHSPPARDTIARSLLAAGLVAVLFQPLRARLQRGVNRLLYGERDEPYVVISRLGQRIEASLAPEAVLPTIVQTLQEALKLPYAAITLKHEGAFRIAASAGDEPSSPPRSAGEQDREAAASFSQREDLLTLPLVYHTDIVGELILAPRSPGECFSAADRRLLEDLARQAGMAAHAVRLSAELQRSRERIVTAREEERRRLRRDLHDGLGAQLAALHLQTAVLRPLIRQDATAAEATVLEFRTELRAAIANIRRLVYDLRPPTLDELGLLAALRAQAAQYSVRSSTVADGAGAGRDQHHLQVVVDAPERLSPLPAAVEVAVYRIVQEALTNVVRHAHARRCSVHMVVTDGLHLEITDDGVGLPPELQAGIGLVSMRERAAELGGTCVVGPAPGGGTHVVVHLPVHAPAGSGPA